MKYTTPNQTVASTYSLLVSSEEKERSLSETVIYMLLILGTVFSIWQFAQQPVNLPVGATFENSAIVETTAAQPQRV